MKTCTVLINQVWGGWYGHVAMFSMKWLLILGFGLAFFGIVLNYIENMAGRHAPPEREHRQGVERAHGFDLRWGDDGYPIGVCR